MIKTYIKRPLYLDKVSPFMDKDIIKVIVGQRPLHIKFEKFLLVFGILLRKHLPDKYDNHRQTHDEF